MARTLILTRPQPQSEAFAAAVAARLPGRFAIVISPLLAIEAVPAPLDLAGVGALAFTSANGVEQFAARSQARDLLAFCVGDMTAAAAAAAGFRTRSADGDVVALAAIVADEHRSGAVLHVRGVRAAGDLVARIAAAGIPARAAAIYRQVPRPLANSAGAALEGGGAVALFSPRTADLLAAALADRDLAPATAVSLSAATDARLERAGFGTRLTAASPSRNGMLDALARL